MNADDETYYDQKSPTEAPESEYPPETYSEMAECLGLILRYVLAIGFIFAFAVSIFFVEGKSMYPTLNNREVVLVRRLDRYFAKAGDIVAIQADQYPGDGTIKPLVKRIIATEGQSVRIDYDKNKVYVDNVALDEPYINHKEADPMEARDGYGPDEFVVPKDCVFVMGDNRNHSTDSRMWEIGPIDRKFILGIVIGGADKKG